MPNKMYCGLFKVLIVFLLLFFTGMFWMPVYFFMNNNMMPQFRMRTYSVVNVVCHTSICFLLFFKYFV